VQQLKVTWVRCFFGVTIERKKARQGGPFDLSGILPVKMAGKWDFLLRPWDSHLFQRKYHTRNNSHNPLHGPKENDRNRFP
jgi:hypothetical protein